MYVIEFAPPINGIEGSFNTFRLGGAWAKRLNGGERVLLIDKRQCCVIGSAEVTSVIKGTLTEMAKLYASENHNHKGFADASERIIAAMKKRYGPNIVRDNSLCTVIYMRLNDETDPR